MTKAAMIFAVLVVASPALPCSQRELGIIDGIRIQFEGRDVPLNAELRAAVFFGDASIVTLERPNGDVSTLGFAFDELGIAFDLEPEDAPLTPGPHTMVVIGDNGIDVDGELVPERVRRIAFNVQDEQDNTAPDPPAASASVRTVGDPSHMFLCERSWPTDEATITVDGDDDAAIATVTTDTQEEHTSLDAVGAGSLVLVEPRHGDARYAVVVRDLAGNVSEPTVVEAWAGGEGGCSNTGFLPGAGVLLSFLIRRRRGKSLLLQ